MRLGRSLEHLCHHTSSRHWKHSTSETDHGIPGIKVVMTSSNGNIFRVTSPLCGEFTRTKASDAELWWVFYLRLNKRLSKQSWGKWFEMSSRPLWHHCNGEGRLSLVCDLNRTPIVMAKHGGSCVHFSGNSTCGRTSRETVSHPQCPPLPTLCKISLPIYVIVTNKPLQPLTTTWYDSLVLSFSLLKI